MKVLVTGHRKFKLENYDCGWIRLALQQAIYDLKQKHGGFLGYAGMASGVDLWFCAECENQDVSFVACIPFEEQAETMDKEDAEMREHWIGAAGFVKHVKNSWMVEECDMGIVVWDGNKGGTHNVVQQLIEKKKSFIWINPVAQKVWDCS